MRVQITKAREAPCAAALRYSPITRLPRGTSTARPSKPRTSRLTTARVKPGRSESSAVSSTPGISTPWGMVVGRLASWVAADRWGVSFSARWANCSSLFSVLLPTTVVEADPVVFSAAVADSAPGQVDHQRRSLAPLGGVGDRNRRVGMTIGRATAGGGVAGGVGITNVG